MLLAAIRDAECAIAIDPSYAQGYRQHARALLAFGPNQCALAACHTLSKAVAVADVEAVLGRGALDNEKLSLILEQAKWAAKGWIGVKTDGGAEASLQHALAALRELIVSNLAIADTSDEHIAAYGKRLVQYVATVAAISRAGYVDKSWDIQDMCSLQAELRECAKCVPLKAVYTCDELKALVFMDAPWTVFGMDRLDREGVSHLAFGTTDPCDGDDVDGPHDLDEYIREKTARATGDGCGLQELMFVQRMMGGKGPDARPQDMTPHHVCAFSISILQRIVLSENKEIAFEQSVFDRIIQLSLDERGSWAGGEFLGSALCLAAGVGKYGVPDNPERWDRFHVRDGALAALAAEIHQSGDVHANIQRRLATIPAAQYKTKCVQDIYGVLVNYALRCMDKHLTSFNDEHDGADKYAPSILGEILDGLGLG